MAPRHADETLWYRLGYALELLRMETPSLPGPGAGEEGEARPSTAEAPRSSEENAATRALMLAGIGAVVSRLLRLWTPRRVPGVLALAGAGAAGAGGALLVELLRPLVRGRGPSALSDGVLADALLSGVGRGLIYGGIVEPRIPGPDVLRGAVFGSVEYFAAPLGGLARVLGSSSPHRRLPLGSRLVEPVDDGEAAFVEHLLFGVAVALLYGALPANRGTVKES